MPSDDDFEPRLGRMRTAGDKLPRKYLSRVIAAANLARGAGVNLRPGGATFSGSRTGRGVGVGRVLARRDLQSRLGRRRVVVKARLVRLSGKGSAAAAAHLRYLQRDGVTRKGEHGAMYDRHSDAADVAAFRDRSSADRHQFRFIVSAEDGAEYDDLKPLTRRLMQRLEGDLGTSLDWVAVDHYDTGYPHTHIVVRGKDDRKRDLIIGREYLSAGIRERASELVDLDLGPRSERSIQAALRHDVGQDRLTAIDRDLLRQAVDNVVRINTADPFEYAISTGRLAKLVQLGLAEKTGRGEFRLDPDLAATLRKMGERHDIIRTMQRELGARSLARSPHDLSIFDPLNAGQSLVGRLISRGLEDEHRDRHYLILDGVDGRSHFVAIGRGENVGPLPENSIVRVTGQRSAVRQADRTIVAVAAWGGGYYDVDTHLVHDPGASQAFAEAHVRRLEAMRRAGVDIERTPSGRWAISPNHLEQVEIYERRLLANRPVRIETLSARGLEAMVRADAATWLDHELASAAPVVLHGAGFGLAVRDAKVQRRQWLADQGLWEPTDEIVRAPSSVIAALQRRELLRVASEVSDELGKPFVEAQSGAIVDGIFRRSIDLYAGRFAVLEKARSFTLVPWKPVLERQLGRPVSGLVRESGVNWTLGRGRNGPKIE